MVSDHGQGVSQDSSVLLPRIQTTGAKAAFSNGQYLLSVLWGFSKLPTLPFPEPPCKKAGYSAWPKGILKQRWDEQAWLCSSKGLLRCSWCLCNFEPLFKIFGLLTTCPNFNIAFSLMSTHLSKHQQLLEVGTILLQGLVWHTFSPLTNKCAIPHVSIHLHFLCYTRR